MYKLILFSIVFASFMVAGNHADTDSLKNQSNLDKYSWAADISDGDDKVEAGRRRGKGKRGRKRGNGLR